MDSAIAGLVWRHTKHIIESREAGQDPFTQGRGSPVPELRSR